MLDNKEFHNISNQRDNIAYRIVGVARAFLDNVRNNRSDEINKKVFISTAEELLAKYDELNAILKKDAEELFAKNEELLAIFQGA